jgi:hypothetical protein
MSCSGECVCLCVSSSGYKRVRSLCEGQYVHSTRSRGKDRVGSSKAKKDERGGDGWGRVCGEG